MRIYSVFEGDRYFSDCKQDHEEDDWKGELSDGEKWANGYISLRMGGVMEEQKLDSESECLM